MTLGKVPDDMKNEVKAAKGITLEEITKKFERASELFFSEYQKNYGDKNKGEKNGLTDVLDAARESTDHRRGAKEQVQRIVKNKMLDFDIGKNRD